MSEAATLESLIVATASPRRRELISILALGQRGITVSFRSASIDEKSVGAGLAADERVGAIALAKARAIEARTDRSDAGTAVLGADTMVVSAGVALGKPDNDLHLRAMLAEFGGRRVRVLTAMALIRPDAPIQTASATTSIGIREFQPGEIDRYVASGAGRGKAGGLELQGAAAPFIANIEGCWSNVVGLPLCRLDVLLGVQVTPCDGDHTAATCHRSAISPVPGGLPKW